jgi:hypothetical protein
MILWSVLNLDHSSKTHERNRLFQLITAPLRELQSGLEIHNAKNTFVAALNISDQQQLDGLWQRVTTELSVLPNWSRKRVILEKLRTSKVIRLSTDKLMKQAWNHGVCYRLSDFPELTGYSELISALSHLSPSELPNIWRKLEELDVFTPLMTEVSVTSLAADAYDAALKSNPRGLSCMSEAQRHSLVFNQSSLTHQLITHSIWLTQLLKPMHNLPQERVPLHPISLNLLTCSWFRGVRRRAARQLGEWSMHELREDRLSIPTCLLTPIKATQSSGSTRLREELRRALAPLLLEWLSSLMHSFTRDNPQQALKGVLGPKWGGLKSQLEEHISTERQDSFVWLKSLMPDD